MFFRLRNKFFGNYIAFYTESSWRMYRYCRRSRCSRQSRVCKFDPPLNPRLGGGFCRNPQGNTALDCRRCKFVYNRQFFYICRIETIGYKIMNRKLKLALAALLGFSAACSTVKNAPSKGSGDTEAPADTVRIDRPVIVMYGVRIPGAPAEHKSLNSVLQQDSTAQVSESQPQPAEK